MLRFQKFIDKFMTDVFRFVILLSFKTNALTDAFTIPKEALILANALLYEELASKTVPRVFETFAKEELMILTMEETFTRLVLRFLHKFETLMQQVFRYPLVVERVDSVGKIVMLCEFSRAAHLPETLVMDKLMFRTSVDKTPVDVFTLLSKLFTVLTTADKLFTVVDKETTLL